MNKVQSLSTDARSAPDAPNTWKRWVSTYVARSPADAGLPGFDFAPAASEVFHGRIDWGDVGSLAICRVAASANRFCRRDMADDANPTAMFLLQTRGDSLVEYDGKRTVLGCGEWSVFNTSRAFSVSSSRETEHIVIMQPGGTLDEQIPLPSGAFGRRMGRAGVSRVAYDLALASFRECARMTTHSGAMAADSLRRFFHLSLEEPIKEVDPDHRNKWVSNYIHEHLSDPALDVAKIAAEFGCSPRHVYRTFRSDDGMTVTEYIWRMRLQRCAEALRDPGVTQSITDIAYEWGFASSAHFSRAFKAAYGVSPRLYRKGGTI
jgi:AraC family transcriptional activator of tynA and feaB